MQRIRIMRTCDPATLVFRTGWVRLTYPPVWRTPDRSSR
jgi:hypothetical protein